MEDEISMLREVLEQSGWSQEQLAGKLGVSFATVNSWLNEKSVPRESAKKRIRDLYLAKDIDYQDKPVYITIVHAPLSMTPGARILLEKEPENDYDDEAITARIEWVPLDDECRFDIAYVANSPSTVARGTWSAGRIYDKIGKVGQAKVLFKLKNSAIAEVTNWEVK